MISIERSYVSLLSTLSDIGGFFDIAVLLAGFAFCFCEDYWFKNFLRRNIMQKSSKEYKKHMDWLKDDEVDDIMDQILDEHQDGIELYRRMGSMKILESIFFTESHKTLIPYILMLQKNLDVKEHEELHKLHTSGKIDDKTNEEKKNPSISIEQALINIKKTPATNPLQKALNKHILFILERAKYKSEKVKKEDLYLSENSVFNAGRIKVHLDSEDGENSAA